LKHTELEFFIVIQQGGSSGEHYPHFFFDEPSALAYIESANRASYDCSEPFSIALPEVANLAESANKTVLWLKRAGFGKKRVTVNLHIWIVTKKLKQT